MVSTQLKNISQNGNLGSFPQFFGESFPKNELPPPSHLPLLLGDGLTTKTSQHYMILTNEEEHLKKMKPPKYGWKNLVIIPKNERNVGTPMVPNITWFVSNTFHQTIACSNAASAQKVPHHFPSATCGHVAMWFGLALKKPPIWNKYTLDVSGS